jgi:hypothetical protein
MGQYIRVDCTGAFPAEAGPIATILTSATHPTRQKATIHPKTCARLWTAHPGESCIVIDVQLHCHFSEITPSDTGASF